MTRRRPDLAPLSVAISGGGVAANCCAHLLRRAGVQTGCATQARAGVPAILLSDPALALLRDVFSKPALFADRPRITHRVVAWGDSEPVAVPHGAVVVSEADLDAALGGVPEFCGAADLTVHTAPPFPAGALRRFGARSAVAAKARLADHRDQSACWIEALASGWLFLIPSDGASAWLLAVGDQPDVLLGLSRLIAPRVAELGPSSAEFETSPRMLDTLQGPGWLACGSAAVGFDPICGDGTAQAVREAILACAVIDAERRGRDPAAVRTHFETILIGAMRRHLRHCAEFYASGGSGEWWRAQFAELAEGFDWCTARLAAAPEPQFELHGFSLVPRAAAA